jgi:DNA-binding NtrC family response regulator
MLQLLERIVVDRTPYSFTAAPSSLDVPRLLGAREYDVIVADVRMPGLDGLGIVDLVREQGRLEEVVLITAFGGPASAADAIARGAFDYITKPFKGDQLLLALVRAMRIVACKRELRAARRLYDLEPFHAAAEAFAREYVRRLADRTAASAASIAERTGLSVDVVAEALCSDAASPTTHKEP